MILELITKTATQLDAYTLAQTQKNQFETIVESRKGIVEVEAAFQKFMDALYTHKNFMPDEVQLTLREKIKNLKQRFEISQAEFASDNYKQVIALDEITQDIKSATNMMHQAWTLHVQEKLLPYRKETIIAETLPQMQSSILSIKDLENQISRMESKLPTQKLWNEFNAKLKQLGLLLENIQGLENDKREFLNKVRHKQAKLSDLTPELLHWCNEQGLSESLIVRFGDIG